MLKVNEIFYSIQGEGFNSGIPAVFLRLAGCNRSCPWCDTKDHQYSISLSDDQIIKALDQYPIKRVIFTGGEPTIQDIGPIWMRLHEKGWWTALETNGSNEITASWDWITCSPKDLSGLIGMGDELKLVYTGIDDPEIYRTAYPDFDHYFLQPLSGRNIPETIQYVKDHPGWRLSLQWHRLINIR